MLYLDSSRLSILIVLSLLILQLSASQDPIVVPLDSGVIVDSDYLASSLSQAPDGTTLFAHLGDRFLGVARINMSDASPKWETATTPTPQAGKYLETPGVRLSFGNNRFVVVWAALEGSGRYWEGVVYASASTNAGLTWSKAVAVVSSDPYHVMSGAYVDELAFAFGNGYFVLTVVVGEKMTVTGEEWRTKTFASKDGLKWKEVDLPAAVSKNLRHPLLTFDESDSTFSLLLHSVGIMSKSVIHINFADPAQTSIGGKVAVHDQLDSAVSCGGVTVSTPDFANDGIYLHDKKTGMTVKIY